ncbi:GNAT family N-acetyltransferase [Paenibacillus spongiae]|uniref:GNAT family N-acetyltransferase n=1 Tax=Paenibacillus spongiae TaxID=2909671 RepID=A0ABY5S9F4_9BACL|nr:GNAT family N-acetyltransferase [Paenibacillus spongiae]UVI29160.1 GNAT family N-acetyltransferase [Paenibacillus spongiae]
MEIIDDRLILRDYTESDFPAYEELERNDHTYKYENTAPNAKQIRDRFLTVLPDAQSNPRQRYELAVCLKTDVKLMGRVSIKLNWAEIREWEIGWAFHSDYWGNGYATEAVKILIGYAFTHLNAHRVVAYANAENHPSEKLMIRVGMIKDGVLRETRFCNQRWCNELIYSVLESEWGENFRDVLR